MKTLLIPVICLFSMAACSGNGTSGNVAGGAVMEGPAAVAQRIVAEHTGTDYKQVAIVAVEALEFSDSSLGCPQQGMAYLQVITPGHKVVAEITGPEGTQRFDVRVAGKHGLICTNRENNRRTR